MFSLDFKARAPSEALRIAVSVRRQAGGVSSASHLPREHWLTVHRGPEVGAKLKLNTDMRLAPFNLDLLAIYSYVFFNSDS